MDCAPNDGPLEKQHARKIWPPPSVVEVEEKKRNNFWCVCVCVCERECPGNNSCLLLLLCVCVPRLTTWHRDPVWVIMTCHRWFPAEVVHRPTSGAFPLLNCRPSCPHKTTTTTTISRHPFPGIHSSGAKVLNSTNNNR